VDNSIKPYLHIGNAEELSGRERRLYRFFEVAPGLLSWGTLLGVVIASWLVPVWAAIFIIVFDLYWLVKTAFLSFHLRANHARLKEHMAVDWERKLEDLDFAPRALQLYQLVLLPFYKEPPEVIRSTLQALTETRWPKERMFVVLASEERARLEAPADTGRQTNGYDVKKVAEEMEREFGNAFGAFLVTTHPAGVPGELPGKGSNIAYACRKAVAELIDINHISYENVLVSSFDIDTRVYPQYFTCLAYHFLTAEQPHHSSFQPVPMYNNNLWEAPALSRVVSTSGTFWQMMQQERPERLSTFSSHSMSLRSLVEIGYWQKNIVSEDSRIFWNHFLYYSGNYRVVPLSYPVSLDANIGRTFKETLVQVYKQQRRWTWGVENVPYLLYGFTKNNAIPLRRKVYYIATQLEGFWSLATNPLLIFMLGWLPLALGGQEFNTTLLSYNLPRMTRTLMTLAMAGLIGSALVSFSLLPPRPKRYGARRSFGMALQWLLIPITILFFGALPGLEAQTRLMLGGRFRLGFWVTPKYRKQ
jgi:hypothetical protein